ncbi:phage tail sheath family protein [Cellulomonas aerilata]|uniref:Tail protein n=1 Tax=Cellulomonas aerilata TaxID=515326 RepID=A0A512D9Y7_9CELL|nr:phage tail sheath subtilisin-like domain-containing protein [Cellulomonas aerilata]GEO33293.1 tail protein [Cellulomonas aerilata]
MPTYLSPGVYVQEVEAGTRPIEGVGTAVAAFVGLAAKGPVNEPTLVSNWTQFSEQFGDFIPGSYLAHSVYGYFLNGGGNCYIVRIGPDGSSPGRAGGNGSPAKQVPSRTAPPPTAMLSGYRVTAQGTSASRSVSVEVTDAGGESPPEDHFKLVVHVDGKVAETFDHVSTKRGPDNVATKVNAESKVVTIEEAASGSALMKPDKVTVGLLAPEPVPEPPSTDVLSVDAYVGDAAERTGFSGLEAVDEVTMVAVPDLMAAYEQGAIDREAVVTVQRAMVDHCELMGDRMAILDAPPELSPQQIKRWRSEETNFDSKFATLYWPWVKTFDPASGTNRFVPPSGHVAGVWARNDDERGVHKAPANEVLRGVITLQTQITKAEQELLNPIGVNCIRTFPGGRGVRVWGARTLSSDPAWRYLSVRRLFNYLEESILQGTQWSVFEPNDHLLWARIRRTISAFLVNEWRKGALFGLTADEAFFVKCDAETNPAEGIDAGQVVCQVGVAPVKPAEFVIFQLAQFSGGTSLVNE